MSNTHNATRERIVSAFIERLRGIELTEDQHDRLAHAIWVASIRARARGKLNNQEDPK